MDDFNFDDIINEVKETVAQIPKSKRQGITLTIPRDNGFLSRDIAECTSEEFIEWIKTVYPLIEEEKLNVSDFDKINQRIKVLKQIEQFHSQTLFVGSNNDKLAQ